MAALRVAALHVAALHLAALQKASLYVASLHLAARQVRAWRSPKVLQARLNRGDRPLNKVAAGRLPAAEELLVAAGLISSGDLTEVCRPSPQGK